MLLLNLVSSFLTPEEILPLRRSTLTLVTGSGHQSPGLWRHPKDQSTRFNDVDHWTSLAQLLEKGKIHGIFIADVLGK